MNKALLLAPILVLTLSTTTIASFNPSNANLTNNVKADNSQLEAKRGKKRVPSGSGCDSARDRAEHPECRNKS